MVKEFWFLVHCKPNSHLVAKKNLEQQGFKTFLPMIEITERRSTRFLYKQKPLFPNYVFVGIEASSAPWRSINSTVGVRRIVSTNGVPQRVPGELILGLASRCGQSGSLVQGAKIVPGELVKILTGPFTRFIAKVDKIEEKERLWVLLEMMGQIMRVQLKTNQVSGTSVGY